MFRLLVTLVIRFGSLAAAEKLLTNGDLRPISGTYQQSDIMLSGHKAYNSAVRRPGIYL
jgi:hypothetical protein